MYATVTTSTLLLSVASLPGGAEAACCTPCTASINLLTWHTGGNALQASNPRAIKNQAKIAASTKKPRYPVYEEGGRIVWIKPGMEELIFGSSSAAAAAAAAPEQPAELKITVSE
jgi:hypothetical protein